MRIKIHVRQKLLYIVFILSLWSIFNFDGQKTILSYLITNYDCEIHDMKKKKGEKERKRGEMGQREKRRS